MPRERIEQRAGVGSATISNGRVAGILFELADALEVGGTDAFRVRAYRSAARTIENLGPQVAEIASEGGVKALRKLPSIGESMAKKILEIVDTGALAALQKARETVPRELTDLLALEGLGPKKLHLLHRELGVRNVDDLEAAIHAEKIAPLAGFGKKTAAKLIVSIGHFRKRQGRFRRGDIDPFAYFLREQLEALPDVEQVEIAGSFRRGKETIGDLDLLCVADDSGPVMDAFASFPAVVEVMLRGDTKTSVRLENGLQVDLRIVDAAAFGAALHYFTGSKEHNVVIRGMAKDLGFKINEYGAFEGDKRVAGRTEEEIFRLVGCEYIPPELREDRGELDAAESGTLPDLVEVKDILGDLQMHSTASDGKNTVEEMARAAKALGRKYIGMTDHSKAVVVAGGLDDRRTREHAAAIRKVKVPGIRVLASIEVDIMKDGSLDLEAETLRDLDVVVASVHSHMHLPMKEMTERVIRAIESGLIHILAHPTGRLIQQREPYEIDMKAVIDACVRNNVALEINAHPVRLDLNDVHARMAKDLRAKIVISTDAHRVDDLDLMSYGVQVARRAWLTKKDVVNTLPVAEFLAALAK